MSDTAVSRTADTGTESDLDSLPLEGSWTSLPAPDVAAPVLAVAAVGPDLWVGGPGGAWRRDTARPGTCGARPPLPSVVALWSDGRRVLAAGPHGVVRSPDAGGTWQDSDVRGGRSAVAVLLGLPGFADHGVALAGTLGEGVLRSEDGGRAWGPATFGMDGTEDVTALLAVGDDILAGTSTGLYRSGDTGKAWRAVRSVDGPVAALLAIPGGGLLAGLEDGRLLRADTPRGAWTPAGATPDGQAVTALAATPSAVVMASAGGVLYRSEAGRPEDAGATWEETARHDVLCFAYGPSGNLLAGTGGGLLASTDDARGWTPLAAPATHDLTRLTALDGHPVLTGGLAGAWVHTGTGWRELPGLPLPLQAATGAPDGTLLAATASGLFNTSAEQGSWRPLHPEDAVTHLSVADDGTGWAATSHGALLHTRDRGATWADAAGPFGALPPSALHALPGGSVGDVLATARDTRRDETHVWHGTGGEWRPVGKAATAWPAAVLAAAPGGPPLIGLGRRLYALTPEDGTLTELADLGSGLRALAAGPDGELCALTDELSLSTDGGRTWRPVRPCPADEIHDVAYLGGRLTLLLTGGRLLHRD